MTQSYTRTRFLNTSGRRVYKSKESGKHFSFLPCGSRHYRPKIASHTRKTSRHRIKPSHSIPYRMKSKFAMTNLRKIFGLSK